MKILCTGGLGLIGGQLSRDLTKAGYQVTILDDQSHSCWSGEETEAKLVVKGAVGGCDAFTPKDLIIHCACVVGPARLGPRGGLEIVENTQRVIELARQWKARLIFMSSSEVLAYRGETDIRGQYSLGKLLGEALVQASGLDWQIIRPFNVTGPRQQEDTGLVMPRFREQMRRGEPLTVFGDGRQKRCFTHVEDFSQFVQLLMESWPKSQVWCPVAHENETLILTLARLFHPKEIAYVQAPWRQTPEREWDWEMIDDCARLGWEPRWSIGQIVREQLGFQADPPGEDEGAGRQATAPSLCLDCGHAREDGRFHFDAPGDSWGAALHHFREKK